MNLDQKTNQAREIIHAGIDQYAYQMDRQPSAVIATFSGGHDSMVVTHIANEMTDLPAPLFTYSVNTGLCADGWPEYARSVADQFGWNHHFEYGDFEEFASCVERFGAPRGIAAHQWTYRALKDRAFDAILRKRKTDRFSRVFFLSGVYLAESEKRSKLASPYSWTGKSSAVWINPCFHWQKSDFVEYRTRHELPINPFYETVGGSGDCQCNWGNFITYRKLEKYSPTLAAGNVALIDRLSRENHGYGWDGSVEGQTEMFEDHDGHGEMTSPFLCAGCSRSKSPRPEMSEAEQAAQMRLIDWS